MRRREDKTRDRDRVTRKANAHGWTLHTPYRSPRSESDKLNSVFGYVKRDRCYVRESRNFADSRDAYRDTFESAQGYV